MPSDKDIYNDKILLSAYTVNNLNKNRKTNITAYILNSRNAENIRRYASEVIAKDSIISRMISQSVLSIGLIRVYQKLLCLDIQAPKFQFADLPLNYYGKTFCEIKTNYSDTHMEAILIGFYDNEHDLVFINPKDNQIQLNESYKLIIISGN